MPWRARDDTSEHNQLRRVVNSLLIFIDRINPKGFLVAATNLDRRSIPRSGGVSTRSSGSIKPDRPMIEHSLALKFKNV